MVNIDIDYDEYEVDLTDYPDEVLEQLGSDFANNHNIFEDHADTWIRIFQRLRDHGFNFRDTGEDDHLNNFLREHEIGEDDE